MTYTDFYRDRAWGVMLEGELHRLGLDVYLPKDNSTIFNSSGATILRSGGNPLKTQVDLFKVTNCTLGVYVGGTNDVINASWAANRVQTLADIKLDLADMLSGPKCKRVVFCNVPSNIGNSANYATSGNDADTLEINSDFNTLQSWWDTNNPTRAGALMQARIFEALGGLTPPLDNFVGTALGTYTDLHPTALAHKILVKAIADAIAGSFMRPL